MIKLLILLLPLVVASPAADPANGPELFGSNQKEGKLVMKITLDITSRKW